MIDKNELTGVITKALDGSKMFLVKLTVSNDNVIDVQLDSCESITIDDCIAVNDAVHEAFDQDGDGDITASDITTVYSILLGN